jgi:hypothetical protein
MARTSTQRIATRPGTAVRWFLPTVIGAALGLLGHVTVAQAEPASATGKGIAGGALLGGELVIFGEAIVGIETPWLYWLGSGLGAIGGAVGGYYIESGGAPRTSYYLLTGGMALSIPAVVVYLDATNEARRAPSSSEGDLDYQEETLDELDGAALERLPEPRVEGALDWDGSWRLRSPSVVLSPTHTQFEVRVFGAHASTQFLFPLLSGAF